MTTPAGGASTSAPGSPASSGPGWRTSPSRPAARNVIGGFGFAGVDLVDPGLSGDAVQGNFIATDRTGTRVYDASGVGFGDYIGIQNLYGASINISGNLISAATYAIDIPNSDPTATIQVQGNFLGTDVTGLHRIGGAGGQNGLVVNYAGAGTVSVVGNLIAGKVVSLATLTFQGNYVGTDVSGNVFPPDDVHDVYAALGSSNNTVVGNTFAYSLLLGYSGFTGATPSSGSLIQGNRFILGNGSYGYGLDLDSATSGNTVQNNEFSGLQIGVYVFSEGNTIIGNSIHDSQSFGIDLRAGSMDNMIGGLAIGEGNAIYSNGVGVQVDSGTSNSILGNSIHDNGVAGIYLNSANDANNNQPAPVLTNVVGSGNGTTITGTLASPTSATVHLEFFANASPDASGFYEGETYLGSADVAVDAGGNFTATITATAPADQHYITATATSNLSTVTMSDGSTLAVGDTSAFSNAFHVIISTPTVVVTDAGGAYNGQPFAATATVAGVDQQAGATLEGVGLTLTYYQGSYTDPAQLLGLTALSGAPTAAGNYTVLASFAGSADYSSGSALAAITIGQASSTTTATGASFLYDGTTHTGGSAVVRGAGTVTGNATLSYTGDQVDAGSYTVIATYAGDLNHTGSVGTAIITIAQASSTTKATGAAFTYDGTTHTGGSAVVSGAGTVTGSAVLSYTGDQIDAGSYTVTATYAGDANHTGSVGTAAITISQANTTSTVASSTGASSYYGQSATFTATVTAQFPGGGTPDGTVQLLDNGQILATATLANGQASWSTSALGLGGNAISVKYLGSGNFVASSTSMPLTQNVTAGVLLLDASGKGALTDSGNGEVIVDGSSIVVDSRNAAAVVVTGNGSVQAAQTDIGGGDTTSGHGQIIGLVQTGRASVADPLANLTAPDPSALTVQSGGKLSISGNQVVTLNPGLYIGGLSVSGNAKVTLNPGVYYLQGGGLSVSGNASITDLGKGVLIYNAPANSGDTISFSGNGNIQLSAMTSGVWAGVTLFQARNSANPISVTGNGNLNVTGTIYAAAATLNITGNAGVDDNGKPLDTFGSSLVLDDLVVSGNGTLVI